MSARRWQEVRAPGGAPRPVAAGAWSGPGELWASGAVRSAPGTASCRFIPAYRGFGVGPGGVSRYVAIAAGRSKLQHAVPELLPADDPDADADAGAEVAEQGREVVEAGDAVAADLHDDVPRPHAREVGDAVAGDVGHEHPVVGGEAVLLGQQRGER